MCKIYLYTKKSNDGDNEREQSKLLFPYFVMHFILMHRVWTS